MNNFIHAIDGFNQRRVYYTDTDSLFIERKYLNILKQKGYFGKGLGQGKNDTNKPMYLSCQELIHSEIKYELEECVKLNRDISKSIHNAKKCLQNSTKCEHRHRYVPENQIIEFASCGPKQKIIKVKDVHSNIVEEHITMKGCPQTLRFDENGDRVLMSFNMQEMIKVIHRQFIIHHIDASND